MKSPESPKTVTAGSQKEAAAPEPPVAPKDAPAPQNEPTPGPEQAKEKPTLTPLMATLELIKQGHREWLPRLRELLRQSPDIYRQVGDLGRQAQLAWANMIAGPDHLLRESLNLFADDLKESLVGPNASRLEQLAAERIVAAWMEVEYFRMWRVQHPDADGTKVGELYKKRFEEADRRLERATAALTMMKRLLPKVIEVEVIQKRMAPSPLSSVLDGLVNGDQLVSGNGKDSQPEMGRFNPVHGVNRVSNTINNSRMTGLLGACGGG